MPVKGEIELAADGTARTYDADGHLRISKSHISKATVNPYYGQEIPGSEKLGLDPNRIYYMFRCPVELARAASTFAGKPILSQHQPLSSESHPAHLVVGAIGSNVEFNDPYLDADLSFWSAEAIAGIETDQVRELSCAYRYVPVMTPGEWHGQRYDGVMTEIVCNHLAQVPAGRAGSDVLAADEAITMKMTKLGKALFVTLGALSPKLAQDSALPALVAKVSGKTLTQADLDAMFIKFVAMDAELDPKRIKSAVDALIALDKNVSGDPATSMDSDDDDDVNAGGSPTTMDEDETEEEKKKRLAEDKKAMDAAISAGVSSGVAKVRVEMREADEARRAVRDVVGDVIAQDSASEIYAFALDHLKVDHKDVTGVPALRALFNVAKSSQVAPAPVMAVDASPAIAKFPQISRFGSF